MRKIKIKYVDFWRGFENEKKPFLEILSTKYEIEFSEDPDILIYSCFGKEHQKFNCIKIFYTGENIKPDFNECDFAFSFEYGNSPKNYRIPLWPFYHDYRLLLKKSAPEEIMKEKTKFCNFVYSNPNCKRRNVFFEKLSKYKRVDSGGKFMNNIGYLVKDKNEFIRPYKFTIAFENESSPGYTTEKIFQPMLQNSIPIYWGNPRIGEEFNTKSFLNWHDYNSDEKLIEKIIEIDTDDNKYMHLLKQPYYNDNIPYKNILEENILAQFDMIFGLINTDYVPVSRTWKKNMKYWRNLIDQSILFTHKFKNIYFKIIKGNRK